MSETRSHMAILVTVNIGLALGLWLQGDRFANTPAYATLLDIAPQWTWAIIYGIVALVQVAAIQFFSRRPLVIVAHTMSITLLATWWLAFVIRWITDGHGTTPVNVLSWGVFLYVAIRAARLIDAPKQRRSSE